MMVFEIGVIYRKDSNLFLAVAENILITFKEQKLREVKPHTKYEVVRSISVDELCARWNIDLAELDRATLRYLAPSPTGIKPHPRGSRRDRQAEEQAWMIIRSGRLAKPS